MGVTNEQIIYNATPNLNKDNSLAFKYSMEYVSKSLTPDNIDIYTFVMTTNEIDRDNDQVQTRGLILKGFLANPVLLYMHNGQALPVGTWRKLWIVTENGIDKLYGQTTFHQIDEVSKLVKQYVDANALCAVSIAFRTLKSHTEKAPPEYIRTFDNYIVDTINVIDQAELVEASIVTVPANASAVRVKALKAYQDKTLTNKQLHELLEQCDMPELTEKSGARLSASNKDLAQKALDLLDEHDKAHKKAFGEAKTHLKSLINGPEKPEPDGDESGDDNNPGDRPIAKKEFDSLVTNVANSVVDIIRKELGREFASIQTLIEKRNLNDGCECNHDREQSEDSKTYNINDLKKHFNKDEHAE